MTIVPKAQPWRRIFFFLLFLILFFSFLLILVFGVFFREVQRVETGLLHLSRKVAQEVPSEIPAQKVERITEDIFGPVVEIEVFADKVKFSDLLDSLQWNFSEHSIYNSLKGRLQSPFSFQFQWKISQPELVYILTSKIIQKTLQTPSFMKEFGIFFHRNAPYAIPALDGVSKAIILYRNIEISQSSYMPVSLEPKHQLLHDIYSTYLYTSTPQERNPKKYRLPASIQNMSVFLLYMPEVQCLISLEMIYPSFLFVLRYEPFAVLLCFFGALAVVLFLQLLPMNFFLRQRK